MLRRPHYIALSLVVLLTLMILNLPSQTTARLKLGVGSLFLPLLGLANSTQHLAGKPAEALTPRSELIARNESLRRENQELRLLAARTEDLERENARLRQLFGWQPHQPHRLKLANVVLREPSNWWRTIQIDLGSRDAMRQDLPVLSPEGYLVGRISSVSLTRSQVALLGDPHNRVAAMVENESRTTGILGASGPLDSGFVELSKLSENANLKPGQKVKTSGLSKIFPKDILIGQIVDSQSVEYGFGTLARVKLAANLDALEEVWVLLEP